MKAFDELVEIVARLRGEGGCPWDRAQTAGSLRPYLLEECYELLHAIDAGEEVESELGDLFFVLSLVGRIGEEDAEWSTEGALARVNAKMIRRHPHVFGDLAQDPENVGLAAWEARKASERGGRGSALDGVPTDLPALLRAHRVSEKAASVGFDWPDAEGVRNKLTEELAELDAAMASGDAAAISEELGDVLFTLVNLGRHLPVSAEDALRAGVSRFEERFRRLEAALAERGADLLDAATEEVERTWRAVKETPG